MSDKPSPTFQDAVTALDAYWADLGCVIWHPYYAQVGAGTMNPATFLRVLGPEPWRVAYVEPSVRPDDARYGENPNRMGLFYQYQVILKPDPGNPQEMYLQSLEQIGIDLSRHDVRFVEDNWQQPALGAWGLGWEVWLDGLEITQFTYFQQAGGQRLDPVSVELTYGLERILMAMQGVEHFANVQWNATHSYGDLNLMAERQHSAYYFETADVERLLRMYQDYEAESRRSLEAGLTRPAYDYLLKCSHAFNVLDARGAIGVTERASYFGSMRDLARQIAQAYLGERETAIGTGAAAGKEGAPLVGPQPGAGAGQELAPVQLGATSGSPDLATQSQSELDAAFAGGPPPEGPADFLLEVGTEELPAGDLTGALAQLRTAASPMLDKLRLGHGEVRVMGTPRRLVVYVEQLAARQPDLEQQVKGPPWERAFDQDGAATRAAEGFAQSAGVAVDELQEVQIDGGAYAVAIAREQGRPAAEVLPAALVELLGGLRFDKSMRWDGDGVTFSRPIRWLLALHGEHLVKFNYGGLVSRAETRGLRELHGGDFPVSDPAVYFAALEEQGILVDPDRRRQAIALQVEQLAAAVGGTVRPDSELMAEVTNLVEMPAGLRGEFDPTHLELPAEVLISVMKVHQRSFPVEIDGQLAPYFIAISNAVTGAVATHGHEQVIKARFADAAYFVARDLKQPLENFLPKLESLTYQADLGSVADKARRMARLAQDLAPVFGLDGEALVTVARAAVLCKADLATQMVVDMTSLQGAMGRYYAVQSGEPAAVGQAIYEHYLPRSADDELPQSEPGLVLAVADRLDTLMGLFAVGAQPTGTRDPYGLRRAAIGLVQLLIERNQELDLRVALGWAAQALSGQSATNAVLLALDKFGHGGEAPESLERCLAFIEKRLEGLLLEQGWAHDVVQAVLAEQGHNPARAAESVKQLDHWIRDEEWTDLLNAYARSARITRDLRQQYQLHEQDLSEESARDLHSAVMQANASDQRAGTVDDFVARFRPLVPLINEFFEKVLVMADDQRLRENRLALLQQVVRLAEGVADLARLEGF